MGFNQLSPCCSLWWNAAKIVALLLAAVVFYLLVFVQLFHHANAASIQGVLYYFQSENPKLASVANDHNAIASRDWNLRLVSAS
jgi:hypothetical protein